MKKYLSTYGKEWVEIRGEDKTQEVRLKTLDEIRPLFENDKSFIFIQGEEITNGFKGSPVHTNGINLKELIKPKKETPYVKPCEITLLQFKNRPHVLKNL